MDFQADLEKLSRRPKIDGWATAMQLTCESFWQALANGNTSTLHLVQEFCRMLHQDDSFDLARLAIPELRGFIDGQLTTAQQEVLKHTHDLRETSNNRSCITQNDFDTAAYREEKDILLDAEINRASVLIHSGGALDPASAEEIRLWLDQRPGMKKVKRDEA
ncbi:unnamed protein product [Zymoseptoria tritici ST99CH_1A5]|uniref:Uncharacterized protein n=1 Tax=Zymoseptoria tritici ST99CH_1A5 TaxID=1276529 RepID=A0A1Y6LX25_ZYMTR|nr:unnamed protein product [Zymoseptoria tritici ST99CH_1A5]